MLHRSSAAVTSYFPLVLTILFGLLLSLLPISSALGSNVGACQGTTTTSKVSFGGRIMTPTLILRANNGQSCAANESSLSLVSLSRTIIVSPNGTSTQNGTSLLSAMTIISNATPSASNPYLLKLEPGNYDLGSQSLTLLPYVDLEGSGEGTTVISSTVGQATFQLTKATLIAASNSEVRMVKISNAGSNSYQSAILIPTGTTNARFTHLTATSSGSTNTDVGLYNRGSTTAITNSTFSTSGNNNNISLYNLGGTVTITDSTLNASNGSSINTAIINDGTTINLTNSTLNASSSVANSLNLTIINENSAFMTITNTTLVASGGLVSYGLQGGSGTITVTNSTLTASGASSENGGFYNDPNGGTSTITNSTLTASGGSTSYGLKRVSGTSKVANSQLSGTTAASNGLTLCPASVNGTTFVLLNASCQ